MTDKDNVVKAIIERLKREDKDFAWSPSLSHEPLTRDQLIKEIEEDTELGRHYVEMIINATVSRLKRGSR